MPRDDYRPEKQPPWCKRHRHKHRHYLDGSRDCSECVAERIADLHRQGKNLEEDI
jgi:hypothetical protein